MPKKKSKGAGLTLSRLYHNSWLIPTRVQVVTIRNVIRAQYQNTLYRLGIVEQFTRLPRRIYYFPEGEAAPAAALQFPFRIIIVTTLGGSGTWYVEDENEYRILVRAFAHCRNPPSDLVEINNDFIQEPV
jgi:hypothetical protein